MLYTCMRLMLVLLSCCTVLLVLAGKNAPKDLALALMSVPVCMLLYWLMQRMKLWENRKEPIICAQATLVNHRQQYSGHGLQYYEKSFLMFKLDQNGKEIEFEVARDEFDRIQLGAKGLLRYQGWRYLSFRR